MLADFFNEIYLTTQILSYNLPLDYENHLIKMYLMGFPDSSVGKESTCNARDPRSIPGSGRSAGEGKGYPLQYSGLENSMDCIVHRVAKSRTGLSDFHFTDIYSPPRLELVLSLQIPNRKLSGF